MANYCGKCGSHLDERTGLCPKCDSTQIKDILGKKKREKYKFLWILLPLLLCAAVLSWMLSRDSSSITMEEPIATPEESVATLEEPVTELPTECNHIWEEATCTEAKVCRICGASEGDPLEHVPVSSQESIDPVIATIAKQVNCAKCGMQLAFSEEPINSLIGDCKFIFTPHQFLMRLENIVEAEFGSASYQVDSTAGGMMIQLSYPNGQQTLLHFLDPEKRSLQTDELDQENVYCASINFCVDSQSSEEVDCAIEFFMACDPQLNQHAASSLYLLAVETLNKALQEGSLTDTFRHGDLLYDVMLSPTNYETHGYDLILTICAYPAPSSP